MVEAGLRPGPQRRGLTRPGRRGTILLYAAAALLGTALFIFLHHLGNRLPYDTAVRRFAAEFATDRPDEGITAGFKHPFESCKFAVMVLAGAREPAATGGHAIRDALLLRELAPLLADYNYCDELTAAVHGFRMRENFAPTQYWYGSKAVYAILLRVLSVPDVRLLIRIGTWAGWIALAAALLLRAPRTLVVASPLIVFGCFFSGIRYFAGSANGTPYLWTVWAAVALALLLHARLPRMTMTPETRLRLTRLLCFVIGMVSAYLFLSDGHTILIVPLIGLLVYFGPGEHGAHGGQPPGPNPARLAVWCMGLYVAGFVAAYVLGQAAKIAVEACLMPDWFGWREACAGFPKGGLVWRTFSGKILIYLAQLLPGPEVRAEIAGPEFFSGLELLEPYWEAMLGSARAGRILGWVAALAPAAAVAFGALQARRGRPALLRHGGWIALLLALTAVQLLVPNHQSYRLGRYLFVVYALGLSGAILVIMEVAGAPARHRSQALCAALGGVGALLVLVRQAAYGAGLTRDSVRYVEGARNLLDGNGLAAPFGSPEQGGPLFALLLALAGSLGPDVIEAARYLNAAAFGVTIAAAAAWLWSRLRSPSLVVWAAGACALATWPANAAAHVWPEITFTAFVVTSLFALDRFLRGEGMRPLLLAAAAAAAACLTSYAGLALVGSGLLAVALRSNLIRRRAPLPRLLRRHGEVLTACLGFATAYALFVMALVRPAAGGALRYLTPAFPVLLVAGTIMLDEVIAHLRSEPSGLPGRLANLTIGTRGAVLAVLLASVWLLFQVGANRHHLQRWIEEGSGYASAPWAESGVIRQLRDDPPNGVIWSTDHAAVSLLAAPRGAAPRRLPRTLKRAMEQLSGQPAAGMERAIAWFFRDSGAYRYGLQELSRLPGMELAAIAGDGVILRSDTRSDGSSASRAADTLRGLLQDARAVVRSDFDVYLSGESETTLIYHQAPCTPQGAQARFFLHLFPAEAADLSAADRPHGFENVGFDFREHGVILAGQCAAFVTLPDYEIVRIRTGQWLPDQLDQRQLWMAESALGAPPRPAAGYEFKPLARSTFDVYLSETALLYRKTQCAPADMQARFFLHLFPAEAADLSAADRPHGFENRGFQFRERGGRLGNKCVAFVELPDYEVLRIRTGQWIPDLGRLWSVTETVPSE